MLEADCISKSYGPTRANDCLSMSVHGGEIVGFLGENGAGKSTFLSILAGKTKPDSGEIRLDGARVAIASPRDALRLGISIVFQHFSLVPTFTIREQLRLAGWTAPQLPDLLASRFSGNEVIGHLSLGEQQIVEIARALVSGPRFLLLDEPTSILTTAEANELFRVVRALRERGTSVVLVTHKLHEAMAVCDRIVVIRHGRAVDDMAKPAAGWVKTYEHRLLSAMFGTGHTGEPPTIAASRMAAPPPDTSPRFRISNVDIEGTVSQKALHDVSLEIRKGEMCAVVGIDGQGQRELADVCAGYRRTLGAVELDGRSLRSGDVRAFKQAGIACLTDDRIGEGIVPGFSVEATLIMKRQRERGFSSRGMLRQRAIRRFASEMIATWGIVPSHSTMPVDLLSGGNIQKVLLARELSIATSLLVANNPSHGLDARTQDLVWDAMHHFVREGGSVLLLITDVSEALQHADRVAVIYEGRLSGLEDVQTVKRDVLERMMVTGWP